MIFMFTGY